MPSYTGSSGYLLMSKYNNYYGFPTGDGHNKIAILDPNAKENDPILPSVKAMNEVLTILGPTQEPDEPPGVVYEWCINSAVVDVANKSVIANSEDGHTYRWDLTNNTLISALPLNAPTGETYTPTLIGPDGQITRSTMPICTPSETDPARHPQANPLLLRAPADIPAG